MEDNTAFVGAIVGVIFIIWQLCILFGLWGGNPEGAFAKIKKLEKQIVELGTIKTQFNEILGDLSKK